MKKLMVPFLALTLFYINIARSESTIEYKVTPTTIHFNLDGELYSYKTDMGSAFFGASVVIIDGKLYIHQKIDYLGLGSVKPDGENSYEWIPEDLNFGLVIDKDAKTISAIRFENSELFTKYTWQDLLKKENTEESKAILEMFGANY